MKRHVCHLFLAALIGAVAFNTAVVGQDKVERRDRKTEKAVIVSGKITEEGPAGVKLKVSGKDETIPTTDILRIFYEDVPAAAKLANNNLFINEEKEKDLNKIVKEYQDLLDKTKGGNPQAPNRRYYEYRIAMLQAAAASSDVQKEAAIKSLQNFVAAHKESWEYPIAAQTLGRLYLTKGDYDGAQKTLEPLAKSGLIPPEIKSEAEFMLVDVLFQANKVDEVKGKIDAALKASTTTPAQKARYAVYQIGIEAQSPGVNLDNVVKKLDEIIARTTTDNSVRALAYNVMGDCYMSKKRPRDAMWSYLWVDVVFPQDRGEHLKAMTRLMKIFDEEKDVEKVQLYKDKISRSR